VKRALSRITLAHVTRGLLYTAVLVVIAVAFVTSFNSGASGAESLGYAPEFRASLPLVCDVVAAVATFMHAIARGDRQMRRTATGFVLVPMLLSWGANAIDHVDRAEPGPWAWTAAVIGLAGLCPVAVAALLYLSTKFHEFEQRQAKRLTPEAAQMKRWVVADIVKDPDGSQVENVVETPTIAEPDDDRPSAKVRNLSDPKPWSARAQELIDGGTPRATAYRKARKEHERDSA
jgi:hypothetical protein